MKLITLTLVIVAIGSSAAGKLATKYLPPHYGGQQQAASGSHYGGARPGTSHSAGGHHFGSQYQSGGHGGHGAAGHAAQYASPSSHHHHQSASQQIPIVRNNYQNDGNGNYNFDFETGNGIHRDEVGSHSGWPHGAQTVRGSYSYTGDDGKQYTVNYKADEGGFHAEGDHLPKQPVVAQQSHGHQGGGHSAYYGAGNAAGHGHGGGSRGAGHHYGAAAASAPSTQYLPPQKRHY